MPKETKKKEGDEILRRMLKTPPHPKEGEKDEGGKDGGGQKMTSAALINRRDLSR